MISSFHNRKVLKTWKTLKKLGALEEVKEKLPEDTNVLIVSDGGMEKAFHTRHEFYSVNRRVKID